MAKYILYDYFSNFINNRSTTLCLYQSIITFSLKIQTRFKEIN